MTTTNRPRGLVLAIGVAGALVAGCSSPAPSAPTPQPETTSSPASPAVAATTSVPAPVDPANCAASELTGSLGPAEGAAGSVVQTLVLTNTGRRTCELRGFPGVSYVAGDDGHQVGPAASMDGARGGEVRLAPGRSAGAALKLVNVANFDPAACRPTAVRGLRVYPPGDTGALFVARDGTGCAGNPPGDQLGVQTLTAR